MRVPLHQIADILSTKTLKASVTKNKLAREIAAYLLDNSRTGELESLLRDMIQERALAGIVEVTATSAHDLTEEVRKFIRAQTKQLYPQAKQIIINERHNPNLIGGIRLDFPDHQLDLSIRAQLNRFRALTTAERTV